MTTLNATTIMERTIQIQEILEEANAHGLRREVEEWAEKFRAEDLLLTDLECYQLAYDEWIK